MLEGREKAVPSQTAQGEGQGKAEAETWAFWLRRREGGDTCELDTPGGEMLCVPRTY